MIEIKLNKENATVGLEIKYSISRFVFGKVGFIQ